MTAQITQGQSSFSGGGSSSSGSSVAPGLLSGVTLSRNAATTLGVAAGTATDKTGVAAITLASAFTKTFAAFVAGTGNGGLDTGAKANSTWYHAFLISQAAGASPDVLLSLSPTAPTMPATYTLFRRIGSILTDGSGNITDFSQVANEFRWKVNVRAFSDTGGGVTANLVVLATPLGVQTRAICHCVISNATAAGILFTAPDDTDTAPDTTDIFNLFSTANSVIGGSDLVIRTDTSSQIRRRATAASVTGAILRCYGWFDDRGQS